MREKEKDQEQWHFFSIPAKGMYAWYATDMQIYQAKCYCHRYQLQNTNFSPGVKIFPVIYEY